MQSLRDSPILSARGLTLGCPRSRVRHSVGPMLAALLGGAALFSTSTATAASPQVCTNVASPGDSLDVLGAGSGATTTAPPVCIAQPGNIVIIVVGTAGVAGNPAVTAMAISPLAPLAATPAAVGSSISLGTVDPQISTYAQRQAIRDHYRGQIDELTFNDELGDGVSPSQALLDAMAARVSPRQGKTP